MPGRIFALRRSSSSHSPPTYETSPTSPDTTAKDLITKHIKNKTSVIVTAMPQYNTGTNIQPSLFHRKERSRSKDKVPVIKDQHHEKEAPKPSPLRPQAIKLDLVMESPPVLMIDSPQQSSGALISGRLQITANEPGVVLDSITMYLECTTSTKRPVVERCRECTSQVKDLYEWNFLKKPRPLATSDGLQELPFSHLIPGHLPPTTHGNIASIDYSLHVRARPAGKPEIEYRRDLIIRRAIRPGNDKNSMRVFPPTHFTLHVTLPNVVHPIGEFPVLCRMQGIAESKSDKQDRWRLRKLTWRIEEKEVSVSPACGVHGAKVGGDGRGVRHEHTREIGMAELKGGWKTDFSADNGAGQIEGEFAAAIEHAMRPQLTLDAPNGLKISHSLILELVIAEEWASLKKPMQATPTGAARVLRTQFALQVTDRAGMGIAWDDEQPPMYEDVPASPPHYISGGTLVADITGRELEQAVEHLDLQS